MDGARLEALRKAKKITQVKLASILNVNQTTVGKWELKDITPCDEILIKIADILDCTTDYLLGRTNTQIPAIQPHQLTNIMPERVVSLWSELDPEQQWEATELFVGIMTAMLRHDNRAKHKKIN